MCPKDTHDTSWPSLCTMHIGTYLLLRSKICFCLKMWRSIPGIETKVNGSCVSFHGTSSSSSNGRQDVEWINVNSHYYCCRQADWLLSAVACRLTYMCLEHHTHGLATYNAELYRKYIRDCYKANRNIIIW